MPMPVAYVSGEKIHLKVALNITEEFRRADWQQPMLGSLEAGEALAKGALSCAQSAFTDVIEFKRGEPLPSDVDGILTPTIIYLGLKHHIGVEMEWTLIDSAQKVVWRDKAGGEGRTASGGLGGLFNQALDKAYRKAQFAMLASSQINNHASSKHPEAKRNVVPQPKLTNPEVSSICSNLDLDDKGRVIDGLKKLRNLKAVEAVSRIYPCLLDSEPNVIREACRTLAVIGDKGSVAYLEPLLADRDGGIKKDARRAIDALRSK